MHIFGYHRGGSNQIVLNLTVSNKNYYSILDNYVAFVLFTHPMREKNCNLKTELKALHGKFMPKLLLDKIFLRIILKRY